MNIKLMQVGEIGTNCYLLEDEDTRSAAIIDPGGEARGILGQAKADGVQVKAILLTHSHYDHTGAVRELREALPGVPVYLHPADAAQLGTAVMPPIGETLPYQEGDTVPVGNLTVQVLHTPGHTPGGVTLRVEDVLFTGDTLFAGDCGRTDLPGGSYEEILASLGRLGRLEGNFHVCPGHEQTSTMDREREINRYLREGMGLK